MSVRIANREDFDQSEEHGGSVVECLTRDRGFEPHQTLCCVLEQDTLSPA